MWFKKRFYLVLTLITTIFLLVINSSVALAQLDFNPFQYNYNFDNLQIFRERSTVPKAPIVIDGREIFFVGQLEGNAADERASKIHSDIKNAINSNKTPKIVIKEENRLPVLYLNDEYFFTVTQEDTIGSESNLQRATYLKKKIESAITQAQKERSSIYLQRQGLIALGLLLIAFMGNRLLEQLQRYPLRKAIRRVIPGVASSSRPEPSNLTTLFRVQLGFAQFALWISTFFIISQLFPISRHFVYLIFSLILNTFNTALFDFGGSEFSIAKLVFLIGLFLASIFISSYITNLLRTRILQVTRMNRGSQEIVLSVIKYGFISVSTIVLLQAYGLNLSSLALIGSALGVGIGFGLQDIARNFASGLVLLFERSVQVGDFIQVGEHLGTVEQMRPRSIVLETLDRIAIIVPNSRLLAEEVINWSHKNSASRLHLSIGVAYNSDIAKVKASLLKAADEHIEVLRNPQPQVFFTEFGDSSLNFELLIWVSNPSRQAPITSDLYFRIEEIFQEQDIEIPFPQRDLNLRTGELPLKLSAQLEGHLLYLLKGLIAQHYNNNK
jgi:small-conductance mechanosensitive channel